LSFGDGDYSKQLGFFFFFLVGLWEAYSELVVGGGPLLGLFLVVVAWVRDLECQGKLSVLGA
jgi:hypothetical protein